MATNHLTYIYESVILAGYAATLLDDAVLLDDGTVIETLDDLDTFEEVNEEIDVSDWPYSYIAESYETDWPYEMYL